MNWDMFPNAGVNRKLYLFQSPIKMTIHRPDHIVLYHYVITSSSQWRGLYYGKYRNNIDTTFFTSINMLFERGVVLNQRLLHLWRISRRRWWTGNTPWEFSWTYRGPLIIFPPPPSSKDFEKATPTKR